MGNIRHRISRSLITFLKVGGAALATVIDSKAAGIAALVLLIAAAMPTLGNAAAWTAFARAAAALALGFGTLGVIFRRGARQAFWTGFVLFGASYALVLCFGSEEVEAELVTTAMLDWINDHGQQPGLIYRVCNSRGPSIDRVTRDERGPLPADFRSRFKSDASQCSVDPDDLEVTKTMYRSAAEDAHKKFRRVGHAFFIIILSYAGGMCGRYFCDPFWPGRVLEQFS